VSNFKRLLNEVYNFHNLGSKEIDYISDLYNNAENDFVNYIFPLMAYIICWHNEGCDPKCNEIQVKKLYQIENGKFKKLLELNEFIRTTAREKSYKIEKTSPDEIEKEIQKIFEKRSMIRGKYFIEFFISYLNSIYSDVEKIIPTFKKEKMHVTVSVSNAILIFGPRLKAPESLREFIRKKVENLDKIFI
jgi:hypothetical protein